MCKGEKFVPYIAPPKKDYTMGVDMGKGESKTVVQVCDITKDLVGRFLFATRITNQFSQVFIAKRMGCSRSKVARIEQAANKKIKSEDVLLYLQALNVLNYNQEPKPFHRRKK